jgi:hypothetical protein
MPVILKNSLLGISGADDWLLISAHMIFYLASKLPQSLMRQIDK